MSYEVDVHLKDAEKHFKVLQKEFIKIHNQDFMQYCNIDFHTGKGTRKKCDHGLCLCKKQEHPEPFKFTHLNITTGKAKDVEYIQPPDFESFIYIPCHWDYDHMVQTEKDIHKAAENLGLEITTRLSW